MICREYFPTLLTIFLVLFSTCSAIAMQSGNIEYNAAAKLFDYTKLDKTPVLQDADLYFDMALEESDKTEQKRLIELALGKYFLVSKIAPEDQRTYVQLARLYDLLNKDSLAKSNFYHAANLDVNEPYTNFWFGEFYFKRHDYKRALRYYLTAYNNGYSDNYDLNLRLAVIYEKLADLLSASKFYQISYSLNPEDADVQEKIQTIDGLNYQTSEYYYFIRE